MRALTCCVPAFARTESAAHRMLSRLAAGRPDLATVVLFGNVGTSKSTLVQKAAGCASIRPIEAPGVDAEDWFEHFLEVAGALSANPVAKILITVSAKPSPLEQLTRHVERLAGLGMGLLAVCVTHMDEVSWTDEEFLGFLDLQEYSFDFPVMFTRTETCRDAILADLSRICGQAVPAQITEENFLKCFNFTEGHLTIHRAMQDAVARLQRLKASFVEQLWQEVDKARRHAVAECEGLIGEDRVLAVLGNKLEPVLHGLPKPQGAFKSAGGRRIFGPLAKGNRKVAGGRRTFGPSAKGNRKVSSKKLAFDRQQREVCASSAAQEPEPPKSPSPATTSTMAADVSGTSGPQLPSLRKPSTRVSLQFGDSKAFFTKSSHGLRSCSLATWGRGASGADLLLFWCFAVRQLSLREPRSHGPRPRHERGAADSKELAHGWAGPAVSTRSNQGGSPQA